MTTKGTEHGNEYRAHHDLINLPYGYDSQGEITETCQVHLRTAHSSMEPFLAKIAKDRRFFITCQCVFCYMFLPLDKNDPALGYCHGRYPLSRVRSDARRTDMALGMREIGTLVAQHSRFVQDIMQAMERVIVGKRRCSSVCSWGYWPMGMCSWKGSRGWPRPAP